MSDHQLNQSEQPSADNNRRTLMKAALSAPPVIATFISKPVQAVQGLSNMASGDASVCRGDDRYGGQSPGFWKALTGKTDPYVWLDTAYGEVDAATAWTSTGFDYGIFNGSNANKWENYSGGTTWSIAGFATFNDKNGNPIDNLSLREILNSTNDISTVAFHLIAGLLNASYYETNTTAEGTPYFMTVEQFWKLYNGILAVPAPYIISNDQLKNLTYMIESNYHEIPRENCIAKTI